MTACRVILHRFTKFVLGILQRFLKFVIQDGGCSEYTGSFCKLKKMKMAATIN
jgi:hypothetical protein